MPTSNEVTVSEVIDNVACTVCGCVCDDLRVTVEQGRITQADGTCKLSEPWFLEQGDHEPPAALVNGNPVSLESGIAAAAEFLRDAHSPLIYGLSRSSTAGQQAAVRLADRLGATVDTTASLCHAPSILALQQVGEQTCSLGEVRNRADLVIFWGCNPADSHPRHLERYSVFPAGEFVPNGRDGRTIVVADAARNSTCELADLYLPVQPGRDFEALWTLRCLVRGVTVDSHAIHGAPLDLLADLADRMRTCRFGIVFFGLGLSQSGLGHLNVAALLRLVRDLNDHTRFYARRMRVVGDVAGADCVLTWQTGYPFSVNLAAGFPRYNPGEFTAQDMLERGEVDACVFLGSEGAEWFSPRAIDQLRRIPTICLDHPTVKSIKRPTVRFTTDVYGIHRPGTAYRMDEIPIRLRAILPSTYSSDEEVLVRILEALDVSTISK